MTNEKSEPIKNFKLGVKESKKFEIPEIKDGVYDAVLEDIELKVNLPDGKGGSFDMLQWNFDIAGKKIHGKTSTTMSNLSKAYEWVTTLTGKEPEINTEFNPVVLQNTSCQVMIKHQKKNRTFNNVSETLNLPYVHDVLPAK